MLKSTSKKPIKYQGYRIASKYQHMADQFYVAEIDDPTNTDISEIEEQGLWIDGFEEEDGDFTIPWSEIKDIGGPDNRVSKHNNIMTGA